MVRRETAVGAAAFDAVATSIRRHSVTFPGVAEGVTLSHCLVLFGRLMTVGAEVAGLLGQV
jgi:hypothetical protein